ncbi:MAG: ATP-binding protein [Terriglobales bacterium]
MSLRTVVLALATATIVVLALLNLHQLWIYRHPTDAALWRPTAAGLVVAATAPGAATPLRAGDALVTVNGAPMASPGDVARALYGAAIGGTLRYIVIRDGRLLELQVPVTASQPPLARYGFLDAVGLLYLMIGLFVLGRRRSAPQAVSFYLFCLASFALYAFHFTGKLNLFDRTIFWGNEAALLVAPCLLLHFALRFPASATPLRSNRALQRAEALLYVPALLLGLLEVALASGAVWLPVTLSVSLDVMDRASYGLLAGYFLAALAVLVRHQRAARAQPGRVAQQARVMAWGIGLALAPFFVLYVAPYLLGADMPRFANWAVASLVLVPLAFAYAIWRHHLLQADMVFRRGLAYTLATAAVVLVYLAVIGLAGVLIHTRLPAWGWSGWLLAILVTALLFEPMKAWLQERLDRLFYRERYDDRRTLIEFGRQMSAQPELERLLELATSRLRQTLSVPRVSVLLMEEPARGWRCAQSLPGAGGAAALLPLLSHFAAPNACRLVLEAVPDAVRRSGLDYLIPCQLQGRTVALVGLGRTQRGELLPGEDLALVEALAGYLAIGIENAQLYERLRLKAEEYERLKDFNQSIVESIQVGVVAVNLQGRVESWNAQMEVLTARPRQLALGQPIASLLGGEFARVFGQASATGGIHTHPKFPMPALGPQTLGPKIMDLAIAPLVTSQFERIGHIILLDDVTATAAMEQQLIQADRLRSVGLLAAGVAHEVNTPLAVISSHSQMLAKLTPSGDPRAAVLDTITRQTFRASEIIANLLNFSRTGAARFLRVELNAVLRDSLALVEHPLRGANIHVILALHPEPVEVLGDAGKLQQVFLNLILNARDAMPHGGTLRLASGLQRANRAPALGWVSVSDSGEGIPAALQHRIFDPFFTTKLANRPAEPRPAESATMSTGTGLGLAVTYGIVQEHGGAIRVHSVTGHGAEFTVELPLLASAEAANPVVTMARPA